MHAQTLSPVAAPDLYTANLQLVYVHAYGACTAMLV